MIFQYVKNDFLRTLYLYPAKNIIRVLRRESEEFSFHFSDIESVTLKVLGRSYVYKSDGYCIFKLNTGETLIITSALISMEELNQFLRVGSQKKKYKRVGLFAFLPFK
ncbi:hypothetical protein [Chondrinema litorale]|uniref:hypothetical protein n=1 Tax=Chondrinema litorale TaxID=2994555 RepID=UPI0025431E70|nr:hypothetical protein [Chondrinema litorale]UZR94290.1 hypothetical protein OQ292_00475 [Chondrinema litorale]